MKLKPIFESLVVWVNGKPVLIARVEIKPERKKPCPA